jgi:(3,5-dihydroxyphenyl)acetyl-CoA 1,2-dioxygenase
MAIAIGDSALVSVGLPREDLDRWAASEPTFPAAERATPDRLLADAVALSRFLLAGQALLERLPPRPNRSEQEQAAAEALHTALRSTRGAFLKRYVNLVYEELTDGLRRSARVEDLVYLAAERYPGLTPTRAQVQAERQLPQKHKEGYEIDQGVFVAYVLSQPRAGLHLVHAMLRPLPESLEALDAFQRTGQLDIGPTSVERRGSVGVLWHGNPRFLNAEDDSVVRGLEIGTDLILLDPTIEIGVLRGKVVEHPKYAGRHVFNAGINLTHLYHGQIGFIDFFIARDMGYVHKMYRGLSASEFDPLAIEETLEKPWMAAVETFAIGGGCQILLVMDHVLAERSTFFNLPARKEGIIPGAANMRLWRLVGDRMARQAILFDRQFPADTPEGRLICDQVVPDGEMDTALESTIAALQSSGVVSAAGNRKAIRIGQEPIDLFRQYMAVYAREQALCQFSPQLIENLERNWNAAQRAV